MPGSVANLVKDHGGDPILRLIRSNPKIEKGKGEGEGRDSNYISLGWSIHMEDIPVIMYRNAKNGTVRIGHRKCIPSRNSRGSVSPWYWICLIFKMGTDY